MSFILDALKKSELERQRQTMPGLMDAGAVPRRSVLPRWAIALGLLLGINLVVLAVVLMRTNPTKPIPAAAVTVAATPTAVMTTAVPGSSGVPASPAAELPGPAGAGAGGGAGAADHLVTDHFSPLDSAPATTAASAGSVDAPPVYAPEIPVDAVEEPAAANTRPAEHGGKATPQRHDPQLSDPDGADNDEVLPSMSELNLTGPNGLPEMHIDVHVFATRPSERFVYINMRRYREGATLQEGPVLERIRRDGAVLNYHGLRFILPRR